MRAGDAVHTPPLPSRLPPAPPITENGRMTTAIFRDDTLTRERMQAIIAAHPRAAAFENCTFDHGDFSRLDMDGFQFNQCSVTGANWLAASLEETQWTKCRGSQCDFSSALLSDARFSHCDLNNSHWRRATLSSVRFQDCKLTGAHLQEVTGWALEFRECLLVSADLRGMSFRWTAWTFPKRSCPAAISAMRCSTAAACAMHRRG